MTINKTKQNWIYLITGIFISLNIVFFINGIYWLAALPIVLAIVLLFLFAHDKFILFLAFLTPLSVNLPSLEAGINMTLPTEPLMFGVLILFVIKLAFNRSFDSKILKHPVTIVIFINLIWILFTSLTSTMPVVSLKFLISRLWFLVSFYFIGTQLFKNFKNIKSFFWTYGIALVIVILYTLIRHYNYQFTEESGHWVMQPFFNDHTSYGAILAMVIPIFIFLFLHKKESVSNKYFAGTVLFLLFVAIILAYSRAAWLSLVGALLVLVCIFLKLHVKWLLIGGGILLAIFLTFRLDILDNLEKNKQDSSTDFKEHIQSMSNISSDASNLERLNRWQCAFRMCAKRPILGYGPGTYQFAYGPFQRKEEKTIISTNAGDMGNAHSEYFGPLSESGIFGMLSFLLIAIYSIYTGLKVYARSKDKEVRWISLATLLGLITYFFHGTLNNFLDTDKASVLFWGFIAILVSLDVYHKRGEG